MTYSRRLPTPFWRWVAVAAVFLVGLLATAAVVPVVHDACCKDQAAADASSGRAHHCIVATFASEGGWWPDVPALPAPVWRAAEEIAVVVADEIPRGAPGLLPPACGPPASRA